MSYDAREIPLPSPEAIHGAFNHLWPLSRRLDLISFATLVAGSDKPATVAAAYLAGYLDGCRVAAFSTEAAWNAACGAFPELTGADTDELPF